MSNVRTHASCSLANSKPPNSHLSHPALPAPVITQDPQTGIKIVVEYGFNEKGQKVKITRKIKTKLIQEHVNERVAERKVRIVFFFILQLVFVFAVFSASFCYCDCHQHHHHYSSRFHRAGPSLARKRESHRDLILALQASASKSFSSFPSTRRTSKLKTRRWQCETRSRANRLRVGTARATICR